MTYRKKYFELKAVQNKYINNSVINSLLMDDGGFDNFTILIKNFDQELKDEKSMMEKLEKVMAGEPLQYVLGYAYFVNSNYYVSPDVLIPRKETEELAVATLTRIVKMFGRDPKITIVDVGCGSGVLGIYLKEYFPNAKVICTDISEKALQIAKKNAKFHKVDIDFRLGNMLDTVTEKIDVIVSNPPYIESEETVSEQTLKYEPHLALFATPKVKYYKEILSHVEQMNDTFLYAFEIGEDMEEELTELLENEFLGFGYIFAKDIYNKVRYLYVVNGNQVQYYEC